MPCVAVLKRPRFSIENPVKKCHVLSRCDVFVQQTVDLARKPEPGSLSRWQTRALPLARWPSAVQPIHPFPPHPQCRFQAVVAEPEHVVIIPAHRTRRLPCARHLESPELGNFLWQQRLLYLSGPFKFLFLYFQLRASALDRFLQLYIAPLQPIFRGVEDKQRNREKKCRYERKLPTSRNQLRERHRSRWSNQPHNCGGNQINREQSTRAGCGTKTRRLYGNSYPYKGNPTSQLRTRQGSRCIGCTPGPPQC